MLPWSVMASAGCSNSRARRIRSSIRLAPSRSEYSEWQCRCTNDIDVNHNLRPPPAPTHESLRSMLATDWHATTCSPRPTHAPAVPVAPARARAAAPLLRLGAAGALAAVLAGALGGC